MFNIFRYIILRWRMLDVVSQKARRHFAPDMRKKLERQVKDLAWLIVENKYDTPTFIFKVKAHITKGKRIIKHAEMSGDIPAHGGHIHFVISNPYQFNFRMVASVFKKEKASVSVQGNIHYCFEMLEGLRSGS